MTDSSVIMFAFAPLIACFIFILVKVFDHFRF